MTKNNFIENLLKKMTIREKVGQLNQCGNSIYNDNYRIGWDLLREGRIGSFLGIDDVKKANELQRVAVEETRLGIPLLLGYDVIHSFKTVYPVPWAESCSWEPELAKKTSQATTLEATANGINWIYAPMIDIARDSRWGRITEGSGEDPYLGAQFAKARVEGIQGEDISDGKHAAACAKHFIGYGACSGGRDYNSVEMAEHTLRDIYALPFKAAIDAGVKSIMTAFHDLNGEPCTGSKYLLTDLLRNEMGFKGVTISDAGSCEQIKTHGYTKDPADTAKTALMAGLDVEMCFEIFTYQDNLEQLVENGEIPMKRLDEAVRRVLTLKYELGLFENPYKDEQNAKNVLMTKENTELSRTVAKRSIVLLKNDNTLPVSKNAKIALIGPAADMADEMYGGWTCGPKKEGCITPVMAFGNKAQYVKGCNLNDDEDTDYKSAVNVAKNSDIIVAFITEPMNQTGEGKSKTRNTIPDVQLKLLDELKKAGKKIVTIVIAGRPVVLTEVIKMSDAVIFSGGLGTQAGYAYTDVIYGDYNPSGKLVNTFPTAVGQTPLYYNANNTGKPPVEEFFWTSKYIDVPIKPLFPFGYGLSYTSFEYSNLSLSKTKITEDETLIVSVDVKNTGNMDGEEVVQLYTKDLVASLTRPMKELKGFKKVLIKTNETKTVTFELKIKDIGFHNKKLEYGVEKGDFKVMVGTNSDEVIEKEFTVI